MDWLVNNGEIYHRNCVHWTALLDSGKCERCDGAIPEQFLRLARSQRSDRERRVRERVSVTTEKS
jgi:hypothetical protein